ncbi:MAG: hypothetical protein AAF591_22440, partial [Verrucomicrobiota bacterium]
MKAIKVWEEDIGPGSYIARKDEIWKVRSLLEVNDTYMVIVGQRLYDKKKSMAEGKIEKWQFLSSVQRAFSPYGVQSVVIVSSQIVRGVIKLARARRDAAELKAVVIPPKWDAARGIEPQPPCLIKLGLFWRLHAGAVRGFEAQMSANRRLGTTAAQMGQPEGRTERRVLVSVQSWQDKA